MYCPQEIPALSVRKTLKNTRQKEIERIEDTKRANILDTTGLVQYELTETEAGCTGNTQILAPGS